MKTKRKYFIHRSFLVALSVFLTSFFLSTSMVFSQDIAVESNYSFKRYTLHDGLPDMKIQEIIQDNQGFIWLGMIDGFARFDGKNFQFFQPEVQSIIFGILIDKSGKPIFKGARYNHRLSMFEDSIISVKVSDTLYYSTSNSRFVYYPYSIYENLVGDRKYLIKENNDSLVIQSLPDEIHQIDYEKVYFDTLNQIMIFPGEKVLIYEMSSGRKTFVEGLSAECFVKNSRSGILAIGQDGIYTLNLVDGSYKTLFEYSFDYNLIALESADGSLIISDYNCIYRFDGTTLEKIATLSLIRDIIFDLEGNLWVATYTGLYNFFQLNFKNYIFPDADVVMAMAEDEDNTLYFSTLNGNLISKKNDDFKNVDFPHFGYPIFSFTSGSGNLKNRHYYPCPVGLVIQNNHDFHLADIPSGNPRRVHVLPNGNILFVLKNIGVFECSAEGNVINSFSTNILQQNITDVVCDKKGRKIVTGVKGITVVDGDSVFLIPNLQTRLLHVACLDSGGGVWVGGESNLNLFYNDSLIAVHHFKNNSIKDIILTKNGWMVVATKLGIALFNPQNYYETGKFDYLWYDHGNGITGLDPHTFALFEQHDGTVWMASSDCAVSFSINKLVTTVQPPLLHILSLESSTDNINGIHQDISKPVALPHQENNVCIRFAGLKYSAAHNIRYYVRLRGLQTEWIRYNGTEIVFSNLLPGKYSFEVYADAGTETSKTEIETVDFEIKAAFWQKWWFIASLITLLLGIAVGLTIYLLKRYYSKQTQRLRKEM